MPRYDDLMQARRVVVEPGEAVLAFSEDIAAPAPVVWSWMNDPEKRSLYSPDQTFRKFVPTLRPGGRTRPGAVTHCVHGDDVAMREKVLDWKPFEYFTVEQDSRPMGVTRVTYRLETLEDGRTRLTGLLTGGLPHLPDFIGHPAIRFIFTRIFSFQSMLELMKNVINAEAAKTSEILSSTLAGLS